RALADGDFGVAGDFRIGPALLVDGVRRVSAVGAAAGVAVVPSRCFGLRFGCWFGVGSLWFGIGLPRSGFFAAVLLGCLVSGCPVVRVCSGAVFFGGLPGRPFFGLLASGFR